MKYFPITIKRAFRRYPISYTDSDSTIDYRMNGLHCAFIYDPGASTIGELKFNCSSRLCYKDM